VVAVLEQPDGAVGPLLDLANALAHLEALGLARGVAFDDDAHQRLRAEPADDRVAAPLGEQLAVVDDEARGRDGGYPERLRRLELRPRVVIGNVAAVVMIAVRDDRVAVI